MLLKFVGGLIIILLSTIVGFRLANRCSKRPIYLGQMISCLTSLKSYMTYIYEPLPEALLHCTGGIDVPVKSFFNYIGNTLEEHGGTKPEKAIQQALELFSDRLFLESAEKEAFLLLGANLGATNIEEQEKYLNLVIAQLEKIKKEAMETREKNARMYQYLGVCGGLAIVILLI